MKGLVYLALNRMIEDKYGLGEWEDLLVECRPLSNGIYITAEDYSDDELFKMLDFLSKKLNISEPELQRKFGQYLFSYFSKRYPQVYEGRNFKSSLMTLDQIFNRETRKIISGPKTFGFRFEEVSNSTVKIFFASKYGVIHIERGVIEEMAKYFNESYTIDFFETKDNGQVFDEIKIEIRRG